MWELLAVFGIYLALSFIGMAALWTTAARKGVVRAPSYFFWMRGDKDRAVPAAVSGEASNTPILNFRPLALAATTVFLASTMSTSQVVARHCLAGERFPNQIAFPNSWIGS